MSKKTSATQCKRPIESPRPAPGPTRPAPALHTHSTHTGRRLPACPWPTAPPSVQFRRIRPGPAPRTRTSQSAQSNFGNEYRWEPTCRQWRTSAQRGCARHIGGAAAHWCQGGWSCMCVCRQQEPRARSVQRRGRVGGPPLPPVGGVRGWPRVPHLHGAPLEGLAHKALELALVLGQRGRGLSAKGPTKKHQSRAAGSARRGPGRGRCGWAGD